MTDSSLCKDLQVGIVNTKVILTFSFTLKFPFFLTKQINSYKGSPLPKGGWPQGDTSLLVQPRLTHAKNALLFVEEALQEGCVKRAFAVGVAVFVPCSSSQVFTETPA